MRAKIVVTSLAVLCLATGAFADLAKATTVSETQIIGTGVFLNTGAFTNVTTIDNLYRDDQLTGAGTADSIAFRAPLTPGTGGEFSLFLDLGALTTAVTLTDIRFDSGAYNPGANTGANAQVTGFVPVALHAGVNEFLAPNLPLTLLNGYAGPATFTNVTFFVNFTTPGTSRLQIDYIANPEPGTIALFAFGAMALGGLAWRRRNAAKLSVVKA